ncbi:MAG: anhydro-N-acetylmuramic acid kinase [Candidatus Pelagibacterales bacterium]
MRKIFYAIGAMSGTSADGIDISLIRTDGLNYFRQIESTSISFDSFLKKEILSFSREFQNKKNHFKLLAIEEMITEKYIFAIKKILAKSNFKSSRISVLGLHGQTVFHDPKNKISLQLINASKIAKYFNIRTISDFRENDISKGGEGAPLVPVFHKLLMKYLNVSLPSIFINIGGISNITYLSKKNELIAFDSGPGMCLLDDYVELNSNKKYDEDGKYSSRGKINNKILKKVMCDKYFKLKYPKSIDRNYFTLIDFKNLDFCDACATISMFTVKSIISGINKINKKYESIYIMGGGSKNLFIQKELSKIIQKDVKSINTKGIKDLYIESQAFAYLAVRSISNLPISYPKTTGVKKPIAGGKNF